MSLYTVCPYCGEGRMEQCDSLPDETTSEPCDGCWEFDLLLEHIAESEYHDDELYDRRAA